MPARFKTPDGHVFDFEAGIVLRHDGTTGPPYRLFFKDQEIVYELQYDHLGTNDRAIYRIVNTLSHAKSSELPR